MFTLQQAVSLFILPCLCFTSMADRPSKLRRLAAVGVPHAKLVEIIGRLREDPLDDDEHVNRWSFKRSLDEVWVRVGCTIKVPVDGGGEFEWHCVSLPKVLQLVAAESEHMRRILSELFQKTPCTHDAPYHLILYADEAVPGNVLRLDNKRKIMCIYVSIRELGPRFLKHSACWFPVALMRSAVIKKVPGGFSTILRHLLRQWFLEFRVQDDGIPLDLQLRPHGFARFYFRLGSILADGDAYRAAWAAKGAAGNVPCLLCPNVVSMSDISSPHLVHYSHPDAAAFRFATSEEIWAKADRITATRATYTKKDHDKLQMTYGLTDSPQGLLWDRELRPYVRPADVITFDAMHITVGNGVVQNETGWLFTALKDLGMSWKMVAEFCSRVPWRFCRSHGGRSKLLACLNGAREEAWKSSGVFKASASEMLMVQPVLMHFLDKVVRPRGVLLEHLRSYEALGEVLTLIRRGKSGESVDGLLASTIKVHAELCTLAYGRDDFKPKNHYLHHLSFHLRRDGLLVDAFVGERKNGIVKQLASDILNTRAFEKSAVCRVLGSQLDELAVGSLFNDSLEGARDFPELAALYQRPARCAALMTVGGTRFASGDAVVVDGVVHIITAGVEIDGHLFLAACRGRLVAEVTKSATKWLIDNECRLLDLGGVAPPQVDAWYEEPDGSVVCLYNR